MDIFDNVAKTAKNIGSSIYTSTKEQGELASLSVQKSAIEKKLNVFYAEIGKRYVEYMEKCDANSTFDVSDVLDAMKPQLDKLAEIKATLEEKDEAAKKTAEEKRLKKAEEEYENAKAQLDKALSMDVVTQEEYDEKMAIVQKKFDNREVLRKFGLQLDMGIISAEEYDEKVKKVLE